jgi:hypothetical protein
MFEITVVRVAAIRAEAKIGPKIDTVTNKRKPTISSATQGTRRFGDTSISGSITSP